MSCRGVYLMFGLVLPGRGWAGRVPDLDGPDDRQSPLVQKDLSHTCSNSWLSGEELTIIGRFHQGEEAGEIVLRGEIALRLGK